MAAVRALILDLGEVLVRSQPPQIVARMAEIAQVPLPSFQAAYWKYRDRYDLEGDCGWYWEAVLEASQSPLGKEGRRGVVPTLGSLDAESWTQFRDEVWTIAEQFRAAGGQTAMLSNCGPEVMDRVRGQRQVDRFFDTLVVSWEVGLLKPDPAIYQLALERLAAEPDSALFVDDRAPNIAGAKAVGMRTLHFLGEGSVEELRRLTSGSSLGTSPV